MGFWLADHLDLGHEQILVVEEPGLKGEDDDPEGDQESANTGDDVGVLAGDDALDPEGEHQLQAAEAGHEVGGDQLKGQGQGSKGHQTR